MEERVVLPEPAIVDAPSGAITNADTSERRLPRSRDAIQSQQSDQGEGMTQWFALRCATRQERKARDSLHEMGFPAYLPCETRWRHTKTDKEQVHTPLFVGYLFVQCEDTECALIKDNAEGVHQFVRYMGPSGVAIPYPIPSVAVDAISEAQARGEFDKTRSTKPTYRPTAGDKVRINASMWVGYLGTVLSVSTDNRKAVIELPKLGNVPLDVGQFEAA